MAELKVHLTLNFIYELIEWFYTLQLVVFNVPPTKIIMDRKTGRPQGFGFVTFAAAEEASAALETMNLVIKAMKNQVSL